MNRLKIESCFMCEYFGSLWISAVKSCWETPKATLFWQLAYYKKCWKFTQTLYICCVYLGKGNLGDGDRRFLLKALSIIKLVPGKLRFQDSLFTLSTWNSASYSWNFRPQWKLKIACYHLHFYYLGCCWWLMENESLFQQLAASTVVGAPC